MKATGGWMITPNGDRSSYTIEYFPGDTDNSEFSYIVGNITGTSFILANECMKATLTYEWAGDAPSDAVLPAAVTDYVGTNMTSRLAAAPTTSDPAYSFMGWSYNNSEVESLPANGTVVTGSWQKVLLPEINLKGIDGPLIKQARFRVTAEGTAAGASGSFETSSDDNGKLDLASAFPYLMKGASKLVIVELETDVSHDKALGTWTIVPKTSGTTIESYEIEYVRSDGDVDDVEYASANSGTSFTLINPLRHIQVSFDETDGPEGLPEAVIIDYGTSPELQPLPDTAEWYFVGWYLNKELTQPYDGSPLTADTVLYAKWEPVPVTAGPEPAPAPNNDEDDVASRLRQQQQQPQAPIASTGDMSAPFLFAGIAAIAGFVVVYRLRRRNK